MTIFTRVCVPTVRFKLVQAVKLDPQRRVTVKAHLTPHHAYETPVLIEGDPGLKTLTVGPDTPLEEDAELRSEANLTIEELEANTSTELYSHSPGYHDPFTVRRVTAQCSVQERQQKLLQSLPQVQTLDLAQTNRLHDLHTVTTKRSAWTRMSEARLTFSSSPLKRGCSTQEVASTSNSPGRQG